MTSRRIASFTLIVVIIVFIIYKIDLFRTHIAATFTVINNGNVIPQDYIDIKYYIVDTQEEIITPNRKGLYKVRKGTYGPQGFSITINSSELGDKKCKPVVISFWFWNTQNWFKHNIKTVLKIQSLGSCCKTLEKCR